MDVHLRCLNPDAAAACARYLRDHGVVDVFASDGYVIVSLEVSSVIRLAEDAVANGWADDPAAAQIIADASWQIDTGEPLFAVVEWQPDQPAAALGVLAAVDVPAIPGPDGALVVRAVNDPPPVRPRQILIIHRPTGWVYVTPRVPA
jgi:hypothetical protein